MYSYNEVLKNNSDKKKLINAVLSQLGIDKSEAPEETYIRDINSHGIGGGFTGFIYYSDTTAFYRKHRKDINDWVTSMADDLGEDAVSMICNFGCIKDNSAENKNLVGRCIYDGRLNDDTKFIENALAWFAAEEVCRLFDN